MDYSLFLRRLREARKKAGMSGQMVAVMLNTTQTVISRYELGERIPKIDRVMELAALYDVSMDWLCGMEDHR